MLSHALWKNVARTQHSSSAAVRSGKCSISHLPEGGSTAAPRWNRTKLDGQSVVRSGPAPSILLRWSVTSWRDDGGPLSSPLWCVTDARKCPRCRRRGWHRVLGRYAFTDSYRGCVCDQHAGADRSREFCLLTDGLRCCGSLLG